jgi:hypothetical protein
MTNDAHRLRAFHKHEAEIKLKRLKDTERKAAEIDKRVRKPE